MSYERELDLIHQRLGALERKVDRLLGFRGWVLGVVAAVALVFNVAVEWFRKGGQQ